MIDYRDMKDIQPHKNLSLPYIIPRLMLIFIVTAGIISIVSILHHVHAQANNINTNETQVFATDSKPYGLTYSEWTGKWWQWAYSVPKNVNPSYDDSGRYCSEVKMDPFGF
jgi:hypothetical protein